MANKKIVAQVWVEHCDELPESGLMETQTFNDGSTILINPETSDFYYIVAGDKKRIYRYNWTAPVQAAINKLDSQAQSRLTKA